MSPSTKSAKKAPAKKAPAKKAPTRKAPIKKVSVKKAAVLTAAQRAVAARKAAAAKAKIAAAAKALKEREARAKAAAKAKAAAAKAKAAAAAKALKEREAKRKAIEADKLRKLREIERRNQEELKRQQRREAEERRRLEALERKMHSKPYVNDLAFLEELRVLLLETREATNKQIAISESEANEMLVDRERLEYDDEDGSSVASDIQRDQLKDFAAALRLKVDEIDVALSRIDDGSYGRCDECYEPISKARLLAQ